MFKINLKKVTHKLSNDDIIDLGNKTEGYSGSDIANIVRGALMELIRTCMLATHFKIVNMDGKEFYMPCSPSDDGSIEMELKDVSESDLMSPIVGKMDFLKVLASSKPSVSQEDLKQYEDYTELFGEEG